MTRKQIGASMSSEQLERLKCGVVECNADSRDWLIDRTMKWGAGEIERLQAKLDKLPKTADGVVVVPGMELRHPHDSCDKGDGWHIWIPQDVLDMALSGDDEISYGIPVSDCYSTREAALAAKENNDA